MVAERISIARNSKISKKSSTKAIEDDSSSYKDIYDVKYKSHEELDIEIQSSRILYILDELIINLEIAAAIPKLLENEGELLFKFLPVEDVNFIIEACQQYVEIEETFENDSEEISLCSASLSRERHLSQDPVKFEQSREKHVIPQDNKPNVNIQQAVAIISSNLNLRNRVNEIGDIKVDDLSLLLIDGARRLREAAVQKLSLSANEEREHERELRKAWKENTEAKGLIKSIQEKLNKQKEELDVQLNAKDELINSYSEKIETMKAKFKEDIKKRIIDSEKIMIQRTQASEEIQTQLQQDSKELIHKYWALLDQHIVSERVLRAKRFKVEAQLANWLAKYDQDIGERQAELEELQKMYDEETNELNELQKKFDEQEEDYIELMGERNEYERKIYEEKAYIFLINRAARRIQRCWLAYRERKRLRKKARKAKKKEKESASGESGGDSGKKKSAASEKGKGKGKKGKKNDQQVLSMTDDPMAKLEAKFKGDILEDISAEPMPGSVNIEL